MLIVTEFIRPRGLRVVEDRGRAKEIEHDSRVQVRLSGFRSYVSVLAVRSGGRHRRLWRFARVSAAMIGRRDTHTIYPRPQQLNRVLLVHWSKEISMGGARGFLKSGMWRFWVRSLLDSDEVSLFPLFFVLARPPLYPFTLLSFVSCSIANGLLAIVYCSYL